MSKLNLKNITLVAMTSVLIEDTIKALCYSSKDINFGCVKLISSLNPSLPDTITLDYIDPITSIDEWNYNIVYNLHKYIDTEFAILIHDDGFIVNPSSWRDDFLDYDYIGAPWAHMHLLDSNGVPVRVGNSVSLRSKKLMSIPSNVGMKWQKFDGNYNEDTQICVWNRDIFLKEDIKYANYDVAKYFSHEEYLFDFGDIKPFCFHNFGGRNQVYKNIINNFDYK